MASVFKQIFLRSIGLTALVFAIAIGWISVRHYRVAKQKARDSVLNTPVVELNLKRSTFKHALDELSAASGVSISCLTKQQLVDATNVLPDNNYHTPLNSFSLSFHLRNTSFKDALGLILTLAGQEDSVTVDAEVTSAGNVAVWDREWDKRPVIVRTFDVADLLEQDAPFAREALREVSPESPEPTTDFLVNTSKNRLDELLSRYAPEIDRAGLSSWNAQWIGDHLLVVAPPEVCGKVQQFLDAVRGNGELAREWPPFPILERKIPRVLIKGDWIPQAVETLSWVSGVNIVADPSTEDFRKGPLIVLDLHNTSLHEALDRFNDPTDLSKQGVDYQLVGSIVLVSLAGPGPRQKVFHLYDLRKIVHAFDGELSEFAREQTNGAPPDLALLEILRRFSATAYSHPNLSDIFAGRLVLNETHREHLRIAAMLDVLQKATSETNVAEWADADGPVFFWPGSPVVRLYNCHDIVDRYSQSRSEHSAPTTDSALSEIPASVAVELAVRENAGLEFDQKVCRLGNYLIVDAPEATHAKIHQFLAVLRARGNLTELQ